MCISRCSDWRLDITLSADIAASVQGEVRDATKALAASARSNESAMKAMQKDLSALNKTTEKSAAKCRCTNNGTAIVEIR